MTNERQTATTNQSVHKMATVNIPITKAKASIPVDTTAFDDDTYMAILTEGLKVVLNAKMTKLTGMKELSGPDLDKFHADALAVANKNLADLKAGKYKFPGAKAKTADSREVQNEAKRLAKDWLRDQIVASGFKISHVPPKSITEAVRKLVAEQPKWLEQARANLANRAPTPSVEIDLSALGIDTEAAAAKADELKAKRKAAGNQLSAKQAGTTAKVAGRATKSKADAKPKPDLSAILGGATSSPANHPGAVH